MTNHIERTKEMIAVMQAYVDGKEIEVKAISRGDWVVCNGQYWNFMDFDYRIRETPDQIDWSHVAPEFKWMARDEGGAVLIFSSRPCIAGRGWGIGSGSAIFGKSFSSYKRGTVSWDKSLVKRPEGV